jgi:hypothetical protein
MTTAQIIDAIVQQGGFDTSATDTSRAIILQWVQERYDHALSESGYRKMVVSLGPTVVNQSQYAIPAHVIEIVKLRVDLSKPWLRITTEELWGLQAADGSYLEGDAPGAYAPNFEADADQVFELWPTPTVAGLAISGLCRTLDATALTDGSGTPGLPPDLHQRILVDGSIAVGRVRVEDRADLAGPFVAAHDDGLKALVKRANSRVGAGVFTARVAGH